MDELPELTEIEEWCEMTPEDERKYENIILSPKSSFMTARRVSWCNDDYMETSSKVTRLRQIADAAHEDGRKMLVFSFFLDTLNKVERIFGPLCVGQLNGSVTPTRRQEIIDRFNSAPPGSVLAAQIQSGGTGLNIQAASVVVICEPQYKPSTENQAIARAHRMGQKRNVFVHRLLCVDSIDERIMEILREKQFEFDTFADGSVSAEAEEGFDPKIIERIMKEELRRIKEKRAAAKAVPR